MRTVLVSICSVFVIGVSAFPGNAAFKLAHSRRLKQPDGSSVSDSATFTQYIHQSYVQLEDDEKHPTITPTAAPQPTTCTTNAHTASTTDKQSVIYSEQAQLRHGRRRRQLNLPGIVTANPLAALVSSLASALAPGFTSALAPVQSAANTGLVGISLVKSAAPGVLPTADVIGPAQSAAAPVLEGLLGAIISAAQPIVSAAGDDISAAAEPVASLAVPLQSAVLPQVENAIGPLVSAIAPAMVAALAPAAAQLSSPLGPIESGLIAPIESAVAPILSNLIGEAVSALTGVEAPIASLLSPVLGAVDSDVLPLITSVVSAVWPAIGPAVTPLNPVICALQPAEVPLGGDATALIPVQCVSITSGDIVPISTGLATFSASSQPLPISGALQPATDATMTQSAPMPSASMNVPADTQSNPSTAAATTMLNSGNGNRTSTLPSLFAVASSTTGPGAVGTVGSSSVRVSSATGVTPISELMAPSAAAGSDISSVSTPALLTCVMAGATLPTPAAAQTPAGAAQSPAPASSTTAPQVPAVTATLSIPILNTNCDLATGSCDFSTLSLTESITIVSAAGIHSFLPDLSSAVPSPAITPAPTSNQGGIILLSYGTQTISFSAMMLPGGALVASFMGSVFALPATAAAQNLARRVNVMPVGGEFDIASFAHELSVKLAEKYPELAQSDQAASGSGSGSAGRQRVITSSSKSSINDQKAKLQIISDGVETMISELYQDQVAGSSGPQIPSCPGANGKILISKADTDYTIVCETNWVGQDLDFLKSSTFEKCVDACDQMNEDTLRPLCLAALFVDDAPSGAADCYLKSSIKNPSSSVSRFHLQAAVRGTVHDQGTHAKDLKSSLAQRPRLYDVQSASNSDIKSADEAPSPSANAVKTNSGSKTTLTALSNTAIPTLAAVTGTPSMAYASGSSVIVPSVSTTWKLGVATNEPASQYFSMGGAYGGGSKRQDIGGISESLLNGTGADFALADTPVDSSTGSLLLNDTTKHSLTGLTNVPRFSRDGGKGGMVNGQHLFTFADTAVYTSNDDGSNGDYINYASSSVAKDVGMHGLYGNGLTIQDGAGEFASPLGAIRGFAPLTTGEAGFNAIAAQAGMPARYSVWPESSLIPFNSTSSIMICPIVYSAADKETKAATFTYTGNTLLKVTADTAAGPAAERPIGRLFNASDVEWGNIGGIRSWGKSGIGGNDGYVYLFGNVRGGLLLARSEASSVGKAASYQYWSGKEWTSKPLTDDSTAYFMEGSFMDVDIFYSPRHLTFVAVYMNIYGDSTFYWRYLKAPQALMPSYAGGDPSVDITEALTKYQWSEEQVLFSAGLGLNGGYSYAGGVHLGYFGQDDIQNGGDKMLLTWTSPTGEDPASKNSAYQLGSGVVSWS